ncbi:MAG: hypothetical protein IT328_16045 [Caldilineaceae bacterium]|nr:hypothetical protein [Caldilineaceae bacterium]
MRVSQFASTHPLYAINFSLPIRDQQRIYDGAALDQFPVELEPDEPYHPGGRGRPNRNQTLAHSQCATCRRVLRNDLFYTLPSMMKRNMVFSHCRACNQQHNADRYETRAELIRARRTAIWKYLAPRCVVCGFDRHMSAMCLHHLEHKDAQVAELITQVTLTRDIGKIESLLHEAAKSIPLCSNCHHMLHSQAINLPANIVPPKYSLVDLLSLLKQG